MSTPATATEPVPPPLTGGDEVVQTITPSHILPDGRFVHLPAPSARERSQFFERAIARHGLLEGNLKKSSNKTAAVLDAEAAKEEESKAESEPTIHPLALASAKLQSNGINELNRAINLSGLLSTGEYFGLSNIVDPSLEINIPTSSEAKQGEGTKSAEATSVTTAAVAPNNKSGDENADASQELQEEQRIKAGFVLKRKYAQFLLAEKVLDRHQNRLAAAIVAQARPDQRLRQLRPHWRLVAPEHGTRALPHATRPTELTACDVDVYSKGSESLGRLASRVPRYATVELKEDYKVYSDLTEWRQKHFQDADGMNVQDSMDVDVDEKEETEKTEVSQEQAWTIAEPFAIADPTLGKLDADFDPKKVTMLTLQFDIEKSSTGFCQGASLEPMSTISPAQRESGYREDETVLVALQHSLFCAKLFESIRRELAPDTEGIGQVRTTAKLQSVVWLSGDSEENFLPPPSLMARGDGKSGMNPLCVVHCHEGEVKVQLDCEYTLRVKLVEAGDAKHVSKTEDVTNVPAPDISGSQSPAQLLALCRALLLHAQETYHRHSILAAEELRKKEEKELEEEKGRQGHAVKKQTTTSSPRILQNCVSLGTKMLFERRIRKTLSKVNQWLGQHKEEQLTVEWLSLSIFDLHSQFAMACRSWFVDVHLAAEELTVTQLGDDGDYRKVKFHSDVEFELYLKTALGRLLKAK
jgi:hypothetical protein